MTFDQREQRVNQQVNVGATIERVTQGFVGRAGNVACRTSPTPIS